MSRILTRGALVRSQDCACRIFGEKISGTGTCFSPSTWVSFPEVITTFVLINMPPRLGPQNLHPNATQ
jgi:hypothetical protein